jgi:hypothetical protein
MTNIYNKIPQGSPNGTLIDNWFEEECLRRSTGTTRTTRGTHFGKITFDPENARSSQEPRDNTFDRVIGKYSISKDYDSSNFETSNSLYGKIKPEKKKKELTESEKQQKDFQILANYLNKSVDYQNKIKPKDYEYFPSNLSPKPEYNYVGVRHLYTQDYLKVPWEKAVKLIPIEKLKKMGAAAEDNVKSEDNLNENGEKKSKNEISQNGETPEKFWLNNINSGNVYRSFIKGNNPWFKSSAFTQKLPYTKGAFQYYQNAIDNPYGKGYQYNFKKETAEKKENKEEKVLEDYNPKDQYFSMNYGNQEYEDDISLYGQIMKNGWLGLRMIKRNFNMLSKSFMVEKEEFKSLCSKSGCPLNNKQIDEIFNKYDRVRGNVINYLEVLNDFRKMSDNRRKEIENFNNQIKAPGCSFVSFNVIESLTDMNFHPDVTHFIKSVPQCQKDYCIAWDDLKIKDIITDFAFQEFFFDVSSCVENDNDFTQILKSLGYK